MEHTVRLLLIGFTVFTWMCIRADAMVPITGLAYIHNITVHVQQLDGELVVIEDQKACRITLQFDRPVLQGHMTVAGATIAGSNSNDTIFTIQPVRQSSNQHYHIRATYGSISNQHWVRVIGLSIRDTDIQFGCLNDVLHLSCQDNKKIHMLCAAFSVRSTQSELGHGCQASRNPCRSCIQSESEDWSFRENCDNQNNCTIVLDGNLFVPFNTGSKCNQNFETLYTLYECKRGKGGMSSVNCDDFKPGKNSAYHCTEISKPNREFNSTTDKAVTTQTIHISTSKYMSSTHSTDKVTIVTNTFSTTTEKTRAVSITDATTHAGPNVPTEESKDVTLRPTTLQINKKNHRTQHNDNNNNKGSLIGGVIGGVAVLLLITGIIIVLYRKRAHKSTKNEAQKLHKPEINDPMFANETYIPTPALNPEDSGYIQILDGFNYQLSNQSGIGRSVDGNEKTDIYNDRGSEHKAKQLGPGFYGACDKDIADTSTKPGEPNLDVANLYPKPNKGKNKLELIGSKDEIQPSEPFYFVLDCQPSTYDTPKAKYTDDPNNEYELERITQNQNPPSTEASPEYDATYTYVQLPSQWIGDSMDKTGEVDDETEISMVENELYNK